MREQILNFPKQLTAVLELLQAASLPRADKFILCGLGGSALAGGLWKVYRPEFDLLLHRDYGLPRVPEYFLADGLLIASSYSGNTEEVLDVFRLALEQGRKVAVMSSGGALLEAARRGGAPAVVLPAGLPPRLAVGYSFSGLCRLLGEEQARRDLTLAAGRLEPAGLEPVGRELARLIDGRLPVVYASAVNLGLAYNWKIRLNETGKTAAFWNVLPEMNHTELAAADPHFFYIFLRDPADDPRLSRRFEELSDLFSEQGLPVKNIALGGDSALEKIFNSVILADWTAYYLALAAQRDPVGTPVIEEFKKRIKSDA